MVELSEGSIEIDGVAIEGVPLQRLRQSLAIIPQDPVIFSGTIRDNLDPFGEHSDAALWQALRAAHLAEHVSALSGLETQITSGGDNLSVGQRQLLCLARAILRRARIVVLDEATASIDPATDALIQLGIRKEFVGSTILTIAHRLATVLDYDRIVVVEGGRVVEDGPPSQLRATANGHFARLLREAANH